MRPPKDRNGRGPMLPEEPSGRVGAPTSNRPVLISVSGNIPPEQWNRLGTRLIPKMRTAGTLTAAIRFEAEVDPTRVAALATELQEIINEIGLSGSVRVERASRGDAEGSRARSASGRPAPAVGEPES